MITGLLGSAFRKSESFLVEPSSAASQSKLVSTDRYLSLPRLPFAVGVFVMVVTMMMAMMMLVAMNTLKMTMAKAMGTGSGF